MSLFVSTRRMLLIRTVFFLASLLLSSDRACARPENSNRPPPREPPSVPSFVFTPDSSNVRINFPEGHRDSAQLEYRNILLTQEEEQQKWQSRNLDKNCILVGGLRDDSSSRISITGCPHVAGEDVEITIASRRHSGQYLMRHGKVERIVSPWSDPQVTTRSLPILEGGTEYSTQSNYSNTQDFGHGWVLRDGDELIQLQTAKITEGMAKVCEEMPCGVPSAHELTVRVGYDSSLMEQESDPESWIAATLTHAQTLFYHPSLGSQIKLKVLGTPTAYPGDYWRADYSIGNLRQHVTMTHVDTNLYVFFCYDPTYFGTVGIAYVGGLCDTNGYALSLNEWRNTTLASGKVVAHEMGHNMGMTHDFTYPHKTKGCNGIMDYGESEDKWSECSKSDFIAQYEAKTLGNKPHCMKVIEPLDPTENDLTVGEESSSTEEAEILEGDGITSTPGDEDIAGTATQTTGTDSKLCLAPNWLGDSYCDDANNVAECDFDQGDCCESKRQGNQYWDAFCQECIPMQC